MKVVILAGGYGTRLCEETGVKPKPMVKIGDRPILWHIMKIYLAHGLSDFIICCGYKGEIIKRYFANYQLNHSDITFDFARNETIIHRTRVEPWRVTLVDTGQETMTGGRIRRVQDHLEGEAFCLTYGDGVGDIDLTALIDFHQQSKALVTLTAVQSPDRFGTFRLRKDQITVQGFREKVQENDAWINGGFFVVEPEALDYIEDDQTIWEQTPLQKLSEEGNLAAYRHTGFWQNMDTLKDKRFLDDLWDAGNPPWKIW